MTKEPGTLSVVATPIGNLADITLRALDTLRAADAIACEDTRVTAKLLARYEIEKPLLIFHAQSGRGASTRILQMLADGKRSALVREVKDRLREDARIEVIPGPAAVTAALSIAGVPTDEFTFLGFLPHKKGRQTLFKEIAEAPRTMVFYESPHRIEKALASLTEVLPEERRVVVLRELTKLFESVHEGSAGDVATYFKDHPGEVRGEFVVIVAP
jgi:16S rRNA (cytidine1402-2'-O)-methyltransferase